MADWRDTLHFIDADGKEVSNLDVVVTARLLGGSSAAGTGDSEISLSLAAGYVFSDLELTELGGYETDLVAEFAGDVGAGLRIRLELDGTATSGQGQSDLRFET